MDKHILINNPGNGTIEKTTERSQDVQSIGKIDINLFENEFGRLQTDEVVLTKERESHIRIRHSPDYSYFEEYGAEAVNNPDIILADRKHESTAFLIKRLPDTNLSIVLRLALGTDKAGLKNSIMTFHRVRDSYLKKMLKRNKVLYNRE